MTTKKKAKCAELQKQIELLKKEVEKINPYAYWREKPNKEFGEKYSETYILSRVPNLIPNHGAGHDMAGKHYSNIEVKSCRMTFKEKWTMNQMHPDEADAYLFVWYNCEEGTQEICFISTEDLLKVCKMSKQHGDGCFTLGATINNRNALKNYMVSSWEELNKKV